MDTIRGPKASMTPDKLIEADDLNPESPDIFQMLIDCRLQREVKQAQQEEQAKWDKIGKKKVIKKETIPNRSSQRHRRNINYNDENRTRCEQSKIEEEIIDIYQEKNQNQQYDYLFQQNNEEVKMMVEKQFAPPSQPLEFYYCAEGLPHRKILPSLRRQLIVYIYSLCYEYRTSRAAFCLGSHIFDEYIRKTNKALTSDDYQIITKACLTLSMKFEGSENQASLVFTEKVSKKAVNQAEKEILCLLSFQLYSENYNIIADQLIERWDKFAQLNKQIYPHLRFYKEVAVPQQKVINLSSFYDKLDCINTISYSHEFLPKDICFNLFFLLIYLKAEKVQARPGWKESLPEIIFRAYGDQRYLKLFARFLLFAQKQPCGEMGQLSIRVGLYLTPFLGLPVSGNVWYMRGVPEGWNLTQLRHNEHIDQYGFEILKKMTDKNRIMI